jgi:putative endonuclease
MRPTTSSRPRRPAAPGVEARIVCSWVYLLRCADGSLYCGWTTDVERRVAQHNAGTASRYTRRRRPVALARAWPIDGGRSEAQRREAAIKRLTRAEKLALIAETA